MKLILFFSIILLSGCCSLPLVKCGPEIEELKVTPNKFQLDTVGDFSINLNVWQYYLRGSNTPTILTIDFKTLLNSTDYSILFPNVKIKINNIEVKKFDFIKPIEYINGNKNIDGFFQIKNCCTSYPVTINFDSIPIVNGLDTVYKSFKIEVSKLK